MARRLDCRIHKLSGSLRGLKAAPILAPKVRQIRFVLVIRTRIEARLSNGSDCRRYSKSLI